MISEKCQDFSAAGFVFSVPRGRPAFCILGAWGLGLAAFSQARPRCGCSVAVLRHDNTAPSYFSIKQKEKGIHVTMAPFSKCSAFYFLFLLGSLLSGLGVYLLLQSLAGLK